MPTKLLSEYSTKQLQQELEQRRLKQENFEQRPRLLPGPINLIDLQNLCEEYLDFIMEDYHDDMDDKFEMVIFTKTMEILYGENIFEWINKQIGLHETT